MADDGETPRLDQAQNPGASTRERESLRQRVTDPNGEQLSAFLTQFGSTGRGGGAVSSSTLRRYLPDFRIYAAWRHILEEQGQEPAANELATVLAERGNIGTAYTVARLKLLLGDFPRRREALAGDWGVSSTGNRPRSQVA